MDQLNPFVQLINQLYQSIDIPNQAWIHNMTGGLQPKAIFGFKKKKEKEKKHVVL